MQQANFIIMLYWCLSSLILSALAQEQQVIPSSVEFATGGDETGDEGLDQYRHWEEFDPDADGIQVISTGEALGNGELTMGSDEDWSLAPGLSENSSDKLMKEKYTFAGMGQDEMTQWYGMLLGGFLLIPFFSLFGGHLFSSVSVMAGMLTTIFMMAAVGFAFTSATNAMNLNAGQQTIFAIIIGLLTFAGCKAAEWWSRRKQEAHDTDAELKKKLKK